MELFPNFSISHPASDFCSSLVYASLAILPTPSHTVEGSWGQESMLKLFLHKVLYKAGAAVRKRQASGTFFAVQPSFFKGNLNFSKRNKHLFKKEWAQATTKAKGDAGWEMETMCCFYILIFKIDYATLQHQETNRALGISIKVTAVVAH